MDILAFIFCTAFVAYIAFQFMGGSEGDLLERRLMQFSHKEAPKEDDDDNQQVHLKQAIIQLLQPVVSRIIERKKDVKSLKQMLLEAGKPSSEEDVFRLMTRKVIFSALGLTVGLVLCFINPTDTTNNMLILLITPVACYRFPNLQLKQEAKKRFEEITYNLPDALDLLTVCVEAGLGLDAALSRVSQEQLRTAPILATELGRVSKEILAGVPRQDAFRNLANRNNIPDLKTFTALLIQTDKLGTSISQSLRTYSDTVRTKRRQRVEAIAAQASVKMIIPMVLFILPAMFVVLMGPAAINLVKNFQGVAP